MMIQLLQLIRSRQSVRKYNPAKPVDRALIDQCIEAARLAPSACNAQPWKYIIVDNPEIKQRVAAETFGSLMKFNKFVVDAPVIVVIVIEKPNFTSRFGATVKDIEFPLIDIGISAEHFCLQAEELGIGSCMIGWFNEKPIRKILGIPEKRKIGLLISLGYPTDGYKLRQKQRKDIDTIRVFNSYDKTL